MTKFEIVSASVSNIADILKIWQKDGCVIYDQCIYAEGVVRLENHHNEPKTTDLDKNQ